MKRHSIMRELFDFIWQNKIWWMVPAVITLVLVGILIIMAQSTPLSPFIYALF